jgi:glycosyltransferase involved in cell wall biosynthesis
MKALFVHQPPSLPSARVRVLGLLPHLGALGVECSAVPFPRGAPGLRSLLSGGHGADAIVLQKKLPSLAAGWAWRAANAPVVFDYDDAVFLRQEPRSGSHDSPARRRRFERALRLADAFTCGNEYLATFCRPRGKPVLVAPSPVPLDVPLARVGRFGEPVRIGWIGSAVNLHELDAAAPALRDLARRRRLVLVVISDGTLELPGVPVEHVPWKLETQERELARLDVGIMPLADSAWARGKCAYKLLQYMAAGLPVVSSPVGMNVRVVDHGRNGLLAVDRTEWVGALERLLRDPDLAAKLALAGRETVEAEYGYPRQASRWAEFLAGLSDARRRR